MTDLEGARRTTNRIFDIAITRTHMHGEISGVFALSDEPATSAARVIDGTAPCGLKGREWILRYERGQRCLSCFGPRVRTTEEVRVVEFDAADKACTELEAEIQRLRQGIWDMCTITGMDTDGDTTPDHMVHPDIVELGLQEVRLLREGYDEAIAEVSLTPKDGEA